MNQSFEEIIRDAEYNKGYDAAATTWQKKYNKLFNASKDWFQIYESTFGAPDKDGNPEYWELRKLLKMPE